MTPGFKPFTVKIHANPFPREHPFNTQDYVVLWNGDVPCSELMQQNSRQDGKGFCVKNMTGLLLAHFVLLVFYKKICLKEGKDWQKLISNFIASLSHLGLLSSFICHPGGGGGGGNCHIWAI